MKTSETEDPDMNPHSYAPLTPADFFIKALKTYNK
jgi:hypothetical protein